MYQDRVNWKVKARCVLFPLPILYLMFCVPTDDAGLKCLDTTTLVARTDRVGILNAITNEGLDTT